MRRQSLLVDGDSTVVSGGLCQSFFKSGQSRPVVGKCFVMSSPNESYPLFFSRDMIPVSLLSAEGLL